jgi:microtubule-associated protein-like 1/2
LLLEKSCLNSGNPTGQECYNLDSSTLKPQFNLPVGQDVVASGDAEGYLRLFRYPCITPRAEFVEAKVYTGAIACARFLYGMRTLVTVGGTDASLCVWEITDE